MTDSAQLMEAFDARVERRNERRDFFRQALGAAAVTTAGFAVLASSAADAQTATVTDADILNFALNLEYLEAQFYSYAFSGQGLAANMLTAGSAAGSAGAQGSVDMPAAGVTVGRPRQVDFTGEPGIQQYAREIAADEMAHVAFLRTALGSAAVAQPRINISGDATGAFTAAGRASGVVTPTGPNGTYLDTDVFDPYASANNFLLGSYIFEDVGVTAYKGSAALITNNTFLDAAAGILAVEAFHAGIIRGALYRRGVGTIATTTTPAVPAVPALLTNADKIAAARNLLDGTPTEDAIRGISPNDDQGISPMQTAVTNSAGTTTATASNFVPTNANGLAYSRTAAQVLNVVYLSKAAVTMGGFFPAGVNGTIRTSAAN